MSLAVKDLSIAFDGHRVLDHLDLDVRSRTITAVLGPSGSGKSTLLRIIAGLVTPDHGRILIDDDDVTRVPTHRRGVGLVFQDEQLFPHLDVARNIGFGLDMTGVDSVTVRNRVEELLELVGLSGFATRRVTDVSGGEAKRVALARALAPRPRVLLLDEPLTGLDAELHDRLALELRRVLTAEGTTAILVTHDAREAEVIADVVTKLGSLQRSG